MRSLTSGQLSSIAGQTSLCHLIDIPTSTGTTYHFTDHDADVTVSGHTYLSGVGIDLSSIKSELGTSPASVTVDLTLTDDGMSISRGMIEAGLLDYANIVIYVHDYSTPGFTPFLYYGGLVANVSYKDDQHVSIDVEPILSFDHQICQDVFQISCRVDFGSSQCGIDITTADNKQTFTVVSVTNDQTILTNLTQVDHYWQYGVIQFTSGNNNGLGYEIGDSAQTGGSITLRLLTAFDAAPGDTGVIYRGCDKLINGGCTKYNNVVNFRGEPFVIDPQLSAQTAALNQLLTQTSSTTTPPKPTDILQVGQPSTSAVYWLSGAPTYALGLPINPIYPGQSLRSISDITSFYAYCDANNISRGMNTYVFQSGIVYWVYADGHVDAHTTSGVVTTVIQAGAQ